MDRRTAWPAAYDILKVPVCKAEPVGKTDYENTPKSLAALDRVPSRKNKIGEIVNLSQFLNCLLWDAYVTGESEYHPLDIYRDICVLAVMSGMEIDKAKRLYSVDSGKVLSRLRHYRKDYKKNHGGNLPAFYKYIVGDESPDAGENNAHLEAPMAFVHDAADAFPGRAAYTRTLPVSELFELDPHRRRSERYAQKAEYHKSGQGRAHKDHGDADGYEKCLG